MESLPPQLGLSNSSASPKSDQEYEGLKLNLIPSGLDHHEMGELEQLEDDLELLEYQRSRSTPKIEITEFCDDEKSTEFKEQ